MANQLKKFTPNLAQITEPLHELLPKSRNWTWGPSQKAFDLVMEELFKPATLALYMILLLQPKSLLMLQHMAWEQYYSRKQMACGDLSPMYPVQCQKKKDNTCRSRRKHLLATTWASENFMILF